MLLVVPVPQLKAGRLAGSWFWRRGKRAGREVELLASSNLEKPSNPSCNTFKRSYLMHCLKIKKNFDCQHSGDEVTGIPKPLREKRRGNYLQYGSFNRMEERQKLKGIKKHSVADGDMQGKKDMNG